MVPGLDISNVNGHVDLTPYRRRGFRVVGVKCTEGMTFNDALYAENVVQASKLGMVVLPYHFGRPESDKGASGGVAEGQHFLKAMAAGPSSAWVGDPVLDYETVPDAAFASAFLHVVANRGERPIVYCSASRVAELKGRVPAGTRYWIADYGVSQLPDLGVPVVMWQYTDRLDSHYDGDHVLVDPAQLLPVPPAHYLVVRMKGRVVAHVKYGKGRVAKFLKTRFTKLVRKGKVSVSREEK